MGVRCRPAQASDESLLREVFASTRAQDLALLGMEPVVLSTLVQMQFEAQRHHYTRAHAGCMAWVVERAAAGSSAPQALGHMWLHLDASGLRLMDIAVLPAQRGQGIAAICVQALLHLADAHGWPVHLHVLADDAIRHWYARLGFVTTAHVGQHQAMTRPVIDPESRYEQA
jgi:GNAT superfamily N-acetyltransferase